MRPIVTDGVAWSVCRSVCLSVTIVSPAKTAEVIVIPFGMWTLMGPGNHVLVGGPDLKGTILNGGGRPIIKYRDSLLWTVQKRLYRLRFSLWCWVGRVTPWNHVLDGGHVGFPGEYLWTVRVRRCGLVSNCFDRLLLSLLFGDDVLFSHQMWPELSAL